MDNQQCVFHLLSKVARAGGRHWQSDVEGLGLTAVQAKVLVFMLDLERPTSQELGEYCALDAASLSGVVDRLIKMDLLQRIQDLQDRRINRIDYSAQGRDVALQIKQKQQPANSEFMQHLSEVEQQQLRVLLKKISG